MSFATSPSAQLALNLAKMSPDKKAEALRQILIHVNAAGLGTFGSPQDFINRCPVDERDVVLTEILKEME